MQRLFNKMAKFGRQATVLAPLLACVATYVVTKDPQMAAFTLMATGMQAPEASANVAMAEAGFGRNAPKMETVGLI